MIHVEGLHKRYGERVLFEDVSWHVKKQDRIGLAGPNGAGKTTLLRMLAGMEEPDSGTIRMASDTTIGYLPQDGLVHAGRTVYDEVVLAFQELLALKNEQHQIEEKLSEATHDDGRAVARGVSGSGGSADQLRQDPGTRERRDFEGHGRRRTVANHPAFLGWPVSKCYAAQCMGSSIRSRIGWSGAASIPIF